MCTASPNTLSFSVAFADTVTFRADDMLPVNTK
ncbi:hypothetical protein M717_03505 [Neisseria gonorrhoeae SK33414]|uniref:Uncharacterized protein n=1 Tax=Neisseria gonorrhoeae 3502 TaxID=1193404 RepID=A0AA44ZI41_NEIGO|nr:hypothetical protein T556_09230 [Neisseria gonorrhoeae NG-k51.05]KLR76122.1 hypothetical protein M717_12140 [Neisseria gonorrhoeae SK33414]KLR80857.1 hypothetical protein M679_09450 [Neisseria gonorrhoeae SK7842]KLR84131.1 hypothetical protein M675_12290 [Neisseria gonorrhoeae SK1902]KLR84221.1 hypothetical protein M684_11145 [Neisseria gonorrhoeae SK15454]KLR90416.1 hypothetical protein M677_06220 [Neisseria gonorrhoeae SK6987]KLR91013.1 hypothetical protein M702_07540 [Neisseria gonorrho